MSRKSSIEKRGIDAEAPQLTASSAVSPVTRAVPPPAEQVAALQERLLEEAGLTPGKRLELARQVLETIERGLEAVTVKGPQSVRVPDNMARMRAAELGVDVLGLRAVRHERTGPAGVVINIVDAAPRAPRNVENTRVTESGAVADPPEES